MQLKGKQVYVGLSGGVDSAVSAALLQEAGARVTGVFIKGWYPPNTPCTWAADRRDAMRVAARLHIPFVTLDGADAYKQHVIDYLLAEYRAGRTPNPDVMCNREVKFGVFYRFAMTAGADYIATGHYVSGEKDQRYFLWAVPKEVLAATIFPLAGMEKSAVRALAMKKHLPVADKKDSQGVCFLGSISVEDFLVHEFGVHPGPACDRTGTQVGTHAGALLHTIGERVALRDLASPGPWYVVAKDVEKNTLTVHTSPQAAEDAQRTIVPFTHANWHKDPVHTTQAMLRYRSALVPGVVEHDLFIAKVPLAELPVPGQSIVFYDATQALVGGGIISA